jgi:hypothetical protein
MKQAAEKAKEGVEEVQTRRDLHNAFGDLGKKTFELLKAGGIEHPELTPIVGRIEELQAKLAEEETS